MKPGGSPGVDAADALHVLAAAAEELRAPARADGPAGLARAAASELQNVLYREAQSAGDALAEAAARELASVAAKLKEEAFSTLKTVSAGSDLYGPRMNHTSANFIIHESSGRRQRARRYRDGPRSSGSSGLSGHSSATGPQGRHAADLLAMVTVHGARTGTVVSPGCTCS